MWKFSLISYAPNNNDKEESCVGLIEESVKRDLEVLYFGLVYSYRKSASYAILQEMKYIEKEQYHSLKLMVEKTRWVRIPYFQSLCY